MSDYRDVLERLGERAGFPGDSFDRLTRRRTRKRRATRLTAGAVALLVATAGTATAVRILGPGSGRLLNGGAPVTYTHPVFGWILEYPDGWKLQEFENSPISYGEVGVFVSNIDHEFRHPDWENAFTNQWDMRGLPETMVAIAISAEGVGPASPEDRGPYRGRLSLEAFEPSPPNELEPFPGQETNLVSSGHRFYVRVWIGELATRSDREAASELVASIRFTSEPDEPRPSPTVSPFDPAVFWPTSELQCNEEGQGSSVVSDPAPGSPGEQMDPIDIARREWDSVLRVDDELWRAGDPSDADSAIVVAIRQDRVVARMFLYQGDGGPGYWQQGSYDSCKEFTGF